MLHDDIAQILDIDPIAGEAKRITAPDGDLLREILGQRELVWLAAGWRHPDGRLHGPKADGS